MRSPIWCVVVAVMALVSTSNGLNCRSDEDKGKDEFSEVAASCLSNATNWDRPRSTQNRRGGKDKDRDGYEDDDGDQSYQDRGNWRNRQGYGGYGFHSEHGQNLRSGLRGKDSASKNKMNNSYKNNTNTSSDVLDGSPLEKVDACVIYCIFHEMKMLDSSDLPDKGKVSRVMLKKVRDPQMRDFIEESVDDCFELLDSDNKRDSCEYSKNLALCLEERGRRNCDDWDDQSEAKSSNNRNSKNPKRAT